MKALDHLQSVTISAKAWDQHTFSVESTSLPKRLRGSPLARSWKYYYLDPLFYDSLGWDTRKRTLGEDFWTLTRLLSHASKFPLHLNYADSRRGSSYISHRSFQSDKRKFKIYEHLQKLDILLDPECLGVNQCRNIEGVTFLLKQSTKIKRFSFNTLFDGRECSVQYGRLFAQMTGRSWGDLSDLALQNVSFDFHDLITLFCQQLPALRHLSLGNIILAGGKWEDVVEGIRCLLRLKTLKLIPNFYRAQDQGELRIFTYGNSFRPDDPLRQDDPDKLGYLFLDAISNYVIHGGRHPSLPMESLDSASLDYMAEVEAVLYADSS